MKKFYGMYIPKMSCIQIAYNPSQLRYIEILIRSLETMKIKIAILMPYEVPKGLYNKAEGISC